MVIRLFRIISIPSKFCYFPSPDHVILMECSALNFRCQYTQQKLQSICAVLTFDPQHKKILTFSVKDRYQLNYFIYIEDFNAETITSLKAFISPNFDNFLSTTSLRYSNCFNSVSESSLSDCEDHFSFITLLASYFLDFNFSPFSFCRSLCFLTSSSLSLCFSFSNLCFFISASVDFKAAFS